MLNLQGTSVKTSHYLFREITMQYKVIYSIRKTISIEIKTDARVIIRAPRQMTRAQIDEFVKKHESWIQKHMDRLKKESAPADKLSDADIRRLADQSLEVIPPRVKYFAQKMGVRYGRITIRNQKTRWGSCSSRGNLNFNCLLMLTPPDVLDYVVVHELCHLKEMNHSPRFWAEVEKVLPDYREPKKWLHDNGGAIIARML